MQYLHNLGGNPVAFFGEYSGGEFHSLRVLEHSIYDVQMMEKTPHR